MKAIIFATISAVVVQPIAFFALFLAPSLLAGASLTRSDLFGLPMFAAIIAIPFIVLIGIPSFLILRRLHRLSWLSLAATGIFGAALPLAIFGWPANRYSGYSSGGNWHGRSVEFFVNGVPTIYGWLGYAQGIMQFALHGLVGALVFYFVWRRVNDPNNSFKPTSLRGAA